MVKELVENSLDAGASRITVEIEGGGIEMIRVVDDGGGMPAADLSLALRRHATSKLSEISDLARIATFGFRGEALASVAAVARVILTSRESHARAGARLEAQGDQVGLVTPVGAPPGTAVEVRGLFQNVPARRAFLRSQRSEAAWCLRVASEAALGRPDVRFEVRSGGRRVLGTPGGARLTEAAREVLGREVASQLIPVNWVSGPIVVVGLIGPPGVAQASRSSMLLMVNGRRVHQRALMAAVEGAYRGLVEVGRHPRAVLDIRCDPEAVDVNVHPTKREVRIQDEGQFFDTVQRACWEALRDTRPAGLVLSPEVGGLAPRSEAVRSQIHWDSPPGQTEEFELLRDELPGPNQISSLAGAGLWRYLGQAHNRYLVVETESGLALLDQHAAHEKVLYARVLAELAKRGEARQMPGQGLLTPLLLDVGPLVVAGLAASGDLFRITGFDLEVFGTGTVRCSAVPIGTRLSELPQLLREVLGEGIAEREGPARRHQLAASVACHSAIRFGDPVSPEEVDALLGDLAATPGGITCPHGRPAVLMLSEVQLLSAFRRH